MIYFLILLLFIIKCESSLKLIFSEEFEGNGSIDENKWDLHNDTTYCDYLNHLNCFTSNANNSQLVNGTLALAAIPQKYLNKFYTTPWLTSKESFTFGRFEMRVALPKGKMLTFAIMLIPTANSGNDGRIDILYNHQTQDLLYGLEFTQNSRNRYDLNSTTVKENLSEFNTYVLEWTNTTITWIFNKMVLSTFNITEELANDYNPFDKLFKMNIYLAVGGSYTGKEYFPRQTLFAKDAENWECSMLIFDYIRVYERVSEVAHTSLPSHNRITSSEVCDQIMPLIKPKKYYWVLMYSDEFEGNQIINESIWEVKHENDFCDGNNMNQLHCKTNRTTNIKIKDGLLIMTALRENYLNKSYTAPSITALRAFKYGRFEIRAAFPHGKMLRPSIFMEPKGKQNKDSDNLSKNGRIDIVSNTQTQVFYYGIGFTVKDEHKYLAKVSNKSVISDTLFNFHTYVMEWTEAEIRWFFDDNHLFTARIEKELSDNYNTFNEAFRLTISLGVGGDDYFPGMELTDQDVQEWPCSLFIIDYVRVYGQSYENTSLESMRDNQITSTEICEHFMPLLRKEPKSESFSVSLSAIISISGFVLFLTLILLNVFLFIRMKKQRSGETPNDEMYDDFYMDTNAYEEVKYSENIYDHPYELNDMNDQGQYLKMCSNSKHTKKENEKSCDDIHVNDCEGNIYYQPYDEGGKHKMNQKSRSYLDITNNSKDLNSDNNYEVI